MAQASSMPGLLVGSLCTSRTRWWAQQGQGDTIVMGGQGTPQYKMKQAAGGRIGFSGRKGGRVDPVDHSGA